MYVTMTPPPPLPPPPAPQDKMYATMTPAGASYLGIKEPVLDPQVVWIRADPPEDSEIQYYFSK